MVLLLASVRGPLKPSAEEVSGWIESTCNPLTILLRTQAKLLSALGKATRLIHADKKRNLSEHSASPLAKFLVKDNALDFKHKNPKVSMSVGSPAFHNKGGRPKHRPWCNFCVTPNLSLD